MLNLRHACIGITIIDEGIEQFAGLPNPHASQTQGAILVDLRARKCQGLVFVVQPIKLGNRIRVLHRFTATVISELIFILGASHVALACLRLSRINHL